MKLFNHILEVRLSSRHKWSHFKLHKHKSGRWSGPVLYRHLVWGKLSVLFGQPHLLPVVVCSECLGEIEIKSAGDESWNYCESCGQIEGRTHEMTTEEFEALS